MNRQMLDCGGYQYFLNGHLMPIEERWQVYQGERGTLRVFSSRRAPGVEISAEASLGADGVGGFKITWRSGNGEDITACCEREGDAYCYLRTPSGDVITHFPDKVTLYPLMRIFTGPVMAALADAGGRGEVLLPDITNPEDVSSLLQASVSVRSASACATCHWPEGGSQPADCRQWQFIGGEYDASTQFWLDSNNRLLRYRWLQQGDKQWDVRLV